MPIRPVGGEPSEVQPQINPRPRRPPAEILPELQDSNALPGSCPPFGCSIGKAGASSREHPRLRNIYRVTVVVGATKRQCHHLWLCLLSETREIERIGLHGHAGLFRGCTS